MARRDRYQPEIRLYWVEEKIIGEVEKENEEKYQDKYSFNGGGPNGPNDGASMPGLDSDDEVCCDDELTSDADSDGSPTSSQSRRSSSHGGSRSQGKRNSKDDMQREHALEAVSRN